MTMIKVCAAGACGRMCGLVVKGILESKKMQLVCAVDAPDSPHEGKDIGLIIGTEKAGVSVSGANKLAGVLKEKKPDVLVDFTVADAAVKNAEAAAANGVNLVIGTTGFSDEQLNKIKKTVERNKISAVVYPNMSVGVNVLFKLAKDVSEKLKDYDIEIVEAHHINKLDSPSGTAVKLAEIISKETGKPIKYGRGKENQKRGNEITVHSIRTGDVVGDHTVIFAAPGERLELVHKATSRQTFANGAIKAIEFVAGKRDGRVYGMDDVLGLK